MAMITPPQPAMEEESVPFHLTYSLNGALETICRVERLPRISANVTADFGNVTDLAGSALRGIDSRFSDQFSSSATSLAFGFGATFLSDSPLSVMR